MDARVDALESQVAELWIDYQARKTPKPTATPLPTPTPTVVPTATPTVVPTPGPTATVPPPSGFELQWPQYPAFWTLGDMADVATTGQDAWDSFDDVDYEGRCAPGESGAFCPGDGINERFEIVSDPAGSGRLVIQTLNVSTDVDDQYPSSPSHTGAWANPRDQFAGVTACHAWGVLFRDATEFPPPGGWMLVHEDHSGGGPPNTALEVLDGPDADTARNELGYRVRNGSGADIGIVYDLGPLAYGHWHYIVSCVRFDNGTAGWARIWHSLDVTPDVTGPPTGERTGIDMTWADGFTWLGIYRQPLPSGESQTVYFWGYGRSAGDPARAVALAQLP
jgi:hypothetical protein